MDETTRKRDFLERVRAAEQDTGITLTAVVQQERLGEALLVRPHLSLTVIPGWTPSDPSASRPHEAAGGDLPHPPRP